MIDKFKSFFQKRKKENTFDSEYTKDVISDIISPLEDVRGVNISKLSSDDSKLFEVRYNLSLTSDVDLEEFKNELLNCKSHIESKDLVMFVSLATRRNTGGISPKEIYAGRIIIYKQDSVKNYKPVFNSFQNVINILNFMRISDDVFANIKNRYSINNHTGGDTYVQIIKGINRRNGSEIPYNFIEVKDDVLNFYDRLKEYNLYVELSFVYENNTGGLSRDNPSYDDIKNGLYDKRKVSILTISAKNLD
jgi:hypothetical protein